MLRAIDAPCGASVVQVGDTFVRGRHEHVDQPLAGNYEAVEVRAQIKSVAVAEVFKSANDIVEEQLHRLFDANDALPCEAFANPSALARARQRLCPQDPIPARISN